MRRGFRWKISILSIFLVASIFIAWMGLGVYTVAQVAAEIRNEIAGLHPSIEQCTLFEDVSRWNSLDTKVSRLEQATSNPQWLILANSPFIGTAARAISGVSVALNGVVAQGQSLVLQQNTKEQNSVSFANNEGREFSTGKFQKSISNLATALHTLAGDPLARPLAPSIYSASEQLKSFSHGMHYTLVACSASE